MEKNRVVIYARYSSSSQTEQSIEGQLRVCKEYAERHGYTVVGSYIDRAISGRTDKRPEFQKMIVEAEQGNWDIVLVYKFDRFARSIYDDSRYKRQLQDCGVQVISASEHIPGGAEGKLAEGMLVVFNQYYSEELAIKTRRGMRESAYKCQVVGVPPFGYYNGTDKKYHIEENEAAAVKEIFKRYVVGDRVQDIITWLTAHGYKSRAGRPFTKNTITTIIKNRRYTGVYLYDDIEIENGMPAIVELRTWMEAQKRMEAAKTGGSRRKDVYMLTGKAFCGECHEPMNGESGTGRNGETYRYYKCSAHKKGLGCQAEAVPKDLLEQAVVKHTKKIFGNDDILQKISYDIAEQLKNKKENNTAEQAARTALNETKKSINNLLNAVEKGIITDSTKDRLIELEERKKELEKTVKEEEDKAPVFEPEIIMEILKQFSGDKNETQKLIDTFVYRVYVYDDHCVIVYYIPDFPPELVSYDDIEKMLDEFSTQGNLGEPGMPKSKRQNNICMFIWGFGFLISL